ncbi:MAG: LacI family transcriptional regulator [Propionibacteriaceae bacterium]|jgi:DNA-binding LacI/PurR family transcriptional regulator|nr:LacI family transcriptional regulator [Propionibacteriaceae bacterium]
MAVAKWRPLRAETVRATQMDVARAAGVSQGLVSLALTDSQRVSDATKARILAVAEELGYFRDLSAADLAAGSSTILGVLLPDMRNPFIADVTETIQASARDAGLMAMVVTGGLDRRREVAAMRRFRALRVAGVALVSPVLGRAVIADYAEQVPVTVVGRSASSGLADSVHVDEDAAAELVVSRLLLSEVRQMVHISASLMGPDAAVAPRRRAVERAAKSAGLGFTSVRSVKEAVRIAVSTAELGISVHNDPVAIETLMALSESGRKPGRDIPVISYDDTQLARFPHFDLTSVSQQPELLGQSAMDLLLSRIADPDLPGRDIAIPPTLAVRSSA